jgi:cytochrome P450
MVAFIEYPDQLRLLRENPALLDSATEEILRWTAPSPSKRRTATADVELAGCSIAAGQKVLVWEGSANRDERRFEGADAFRIARDPNSHLSLGHGVHFCLGAHLARLEIRVALSEVLAAFSDFKLAGAPEWTRSNRHTGLRHLPLQMSRPVISASSR